MLLSTDTEIDEELYEDLAPAIARTYRLDYNGVEASARVVEGYFWEEDSRSPARSPVAAAEGDERTVIPLLPQPEREEGIVPR